MARYEYKVIAAPTAAPKAKGVKGTAERYALALSETMNRTAVDGWEYVRAEALPCVAKSGFLSRKTVAQIQHVLVFRRPAESLAARGPAVHTPEELAGDLPAAPRRPETAEQAPLKAPMFQRSHPEAEAPRLGPARPDEHGNIRPLPGTGRQG